jgi:hypothetical protein
MLPLSIPGLHPRLLYIVPSGLPLRMELLHFRLDVLHFTLAVPRVAPTVIVYRPFGTPTADGTFTFYILDWHFICCLYLSPGCTRGYCISSLRDSHCGWNFYILHFRLGFICCLYLSNGCTHGYRISSLRDSHCGWNFYILHFRLGILYAAFIYPRVALAVTVYRPFGTPTADGTFTFYILDWAFYMLPLSIQRVVPAVIVYRPFGTSRPLLLRKKNPNFKLEIGVSHFSILLVSLLLDIHPFIILLQHAFHRKFFFGAQNAGLHHLNPLGFIVIIGGHYLIENDLVHRIQVVLV